MRRILLPIIILLLVMGCTTYKNGIADPGLGYDQTGREIDNKYWRPRAEVVAWCSRNEGHLVKQGLACLKLQYPLSLNLPPDWGRCTAVFSNDIADKPFMAAIWKYANAYCQLWEPLDN